MAPCSGKDALRSSPRARVMPSRLVSGSTHPRGSAGAAAAAADRHSSSRARHQLRGRMLGSRGAAAAPRYIMALVSLTAQDSGFCTAEVRYLYLLL